MLPSLGPGIPFLRAPSAPPAGVEAASEALSTEEAGSTASPDVDEGGDEIMSFALSLSSEGVLLLGKRESRVEDSFRTMARLGRPLAEREVDEFEEDMSKSEMFSILYNGSCSKL